LSASVVVLSILAIQLSNPLVLAQGTAFGPATTAPATTVTWTQTKTITSPVTTITSQIPTTTVFTTETQTRTSSTTYASTITTSTTETEETTFTTSSTTTRTTTVTSPTATFTTGTTETQTQTSRSVYTTTATTSITETAITITSMTTWTTTWTQTTTYVTGMATVYISCNHLSVPVGSTVVCSAIVIGTGSPPPTGHVLWSSNSSGMFKKAFCPLSQQVTYSTCSVKFTPAAVGTVVLTGGYLGNTEYSQSNGTSKSLTVTPYVAKTSLACKPTSVVAGSSTVITCEAHVTGFFPAGIVSWSQSGKGSVSLSSTTCALRLGKCSVTMTGATAGKVNITASYSGDLNNGGKSKTTKLTIT